MAYIEIHTAPLTRELLVYDARTDTILFTGSLEEVEAFLAELNEGF
jgi:hypothetical protein